VKDAADGEQVLLVNLARRLHWQHGRSRGATARGRRLLIDHNQLEALSQALRNDLLAHFLRGQGLSVDSSTLGIFMIHIIGQQGIIRDHIVVIQRTFVREIVRGDGQTGGDRERLPVDACKRIQAGISRFLPGIG